MELEFLQTYYWRVTAHSNYEEPAAISSTWLFNVTPEKPVITSISKPQILCKDEDFAIMINAEGRVMQFQWYRDGELIPGATKPLLTKSNIDFPYSGLFMCRVTNYPGWDTVYSDNIALYVITDTDFLIQPKDQVGYIGGSVDFTFRVHINGKEDRNYADIKWFRNDVLLEDNHQINGAKSDILNVNFLTQSDMDSKYRVEVIGQCGDVIKSEVVSIIALPEPSIVVIDTNFCTDSDILIPMSSVIDLPIGINLRIDVVTSENYEQVDINQQQYLKLKYENNSSDLKQIILKYVHPSTNYLVGEVTYKFYVLTTPVIAKDLPAQIAVKEGDRLELGSYCFIQPSIFSDWYLNDVLYTQAWNSSLIWDKVSTKNQGLWKVRYYNTCGEVWSKECEVTITPKSEVTAVAGNEFANEIIVSPNPASEFLSVNLQSTFDTFVIFDILGNKLIESNIDPSLKTLTIDLNVNNIQSGSYFIIFRKAGEIRTVKFSVIK